MKKREKEPSSEEQGQAAEGGEERSEKFVLVGYNPIVVTGIWEKGGISTAISSDGKKLTISDVEEHEGCYLEWWKDKDGHMYFEPSLKG